MKALVQEFERLKEELDEICLLRTRVRKGMEDEEEKADLAKKKAANFRRQMSIGAMSDPVDDILAGKNPDYSIFDKLKSRAKEQERLVEIHKETRRALNDKAGDLSSRKDNIEEKIQNCRRDIIKTAGLNLLRKTDKQLVLNLLLAVGIWSGQPLIKALEQVPSFLSGENWGIVYESAVEDLLKKSGAAVTL